MEAIVQLKRATTPGDTRFPCAQGVCDKFFMDGVLGPFRANCSSPVLGTNQSKVHHRWRIEALQYTADARSPHVPRTGKGVAGARVHGLGLSWKLSCSPNYPVLYSRRYTRTSPWRSVPVCYQ